MVRDATLGRPGRAHGAHVKRERPGLIPDAEVLESARRYPAAAQAVANVDPDGIVRALLVGSTFAERMAGYVHPTITKLLRTSAAASYLGVSTRTFYDHVRKHVPTVRIGARVLFDTADLDAYATSQKTPPSVEPAAEPVRPPPASRSETVRPPQVRWVLGENGKLQRAADEPARLPKRSKRLKEMKP